MSDIKPIRIAVASDLHAHSGHKNSPSQLNINNSQSPVGQHPIASLVELIRREELHATVLLSPGDLGHQADAQGIRYSWQALAQISDALGADFLAATAGNHDIDSRYETNDHAPEHILKSLEPSFPFGDETLDNKYWARAYAIRDHVQFRLLVVNSSAFHGSTAVEHNHGRIDTATLEAIRKDLSKRDHRDVNILLCHHNPHQHSEINLGEDDVMKQGQLLLDLLGSGTFGRWFVIHGHKHHPKITYAAGGSQSPVVFSAGSLCSALYTELQSVARNQFYIIEIDPADCKSRGLVGRIKAWDWVFGTGWIEAQLGSGLPSEFGFGSRQDARILAQNVAKQMNGSPSVDWLVLAHAVPDLRYLLPQDVRQLDLELSRHHKIRITWQGSRPAELGRTA